MVVWAVIVGGCVVGPLVAKAETLVVPAITVSERYDSNVFNSEVVPGVKPSDYVSSVAPQVRMLHKGALGEGTFQLIGIGEKYINNPDLDYFGGGGGFNFNLDRLVKQFMPQASLLVTDNIFYTPQAPSYSVSDAPGETLNPLTRGIQIVRVRTLTNNASAVGRYALTPTVNFVATYVHSMIRYGGTFTSAIGFNLIDTNSQLITAGPQFQVSRQDILGVSYIYQQTDFLGGQTTGIANQFVTHGGTATWLRNWSPEVKSNVYGGASVLQQDSGLPSGGGGQGTSGTPVYYNGGASLTWTETSGGSSTVMGAVSPSPGLGGGGGGGFSGGGAAKTLAALNYSVGVFPSTYSAGVPLISHVLTASVNRRIGSNVYGWGNGNYSRNDSLSSATSFADISFQSYGGGGGVAYMFTPTLFASLNADYQRLKGNGLGVSGVSGGASANFERYTTMLSLTTFWK